MYKNNAVRWFLKSYYLLFDLYEIMRPGKSSERGGGGMWLCITSKEVSYYCTTFYCRILSLYIYIYK